MMIVKCERTGGVGGSVGLLSERAAQCTGQLATEYGKD